MSIGTFDGAYPAEALHEPVERAIRQRVPKQTSAEAKAAYALVTRRDEETCVRCRRGGNMQRDHRQNRLPGNTVPSNLQLLCGPSTAGEGCHSWKTHNPDEAIVAGFAIPRHTMFTPAEWPARRWTRTMHGTYREAWVLYFDVPEHGRMWLEIPDIDAHYRRRQAGIL